MTQTPVLTHSNSLVSAQDFWEFKVQLADYVTWHATCCPRARRALGDKIGDSDRKTVEPKSQNTQCWILLLCRVVVLLERGTSIYLPFSTRVGNEELSWFTFTCTFQATINFKFAR
jgi:hypothetical protein